MSEKLRVTSFRGNEAANTKADETIHQAMAVLGSSWPTFMTDLIFSIEIHFEAELEWLSPDQWFGAFARRSDLSFEVLAEADRAEDALVAIWKAMCERYPEKAAKIAKRRVESSKKFMVEGFQDGFEPAALAAGEIAGEYCPRKDWDELVNPFTAIIKRHTEVDGHDAAHWKRMADFAIETSIRQSTVVKDSEEIKPPVLTEFKDEDSWAESAAQKLHHIEERLARRPALDGCRDIFQKIELAISTAAKADASQAEVEIALKILAQFRYGRQPLAEVAETAKNAVENLMLTKKRLDEKIVKLKKQITAAEISLELADDLIQVQWGGSPSQKGGFGSRRVKDYWKSRKEFDSLNELLARFTEATPPEGGWPQRTKKKI